MIGRVLDIDTRDVFRMSTEEFADEGGAVVITTEVVVGHTPSGHSLSGHS